MVRRERGVRVELEPGVRGAEDGERVFELGSKGLGSKGLGAKGLEPEETGTEETDGSEQGEARRALLERSRRRLEGPGAGARPGRWDWPEVAGRLAELSQWRGGPALTLALRLVRDAQRRGEPVAWVGPRQSSFYPPDAAELGVDLGALAVVRPPREEDLALAAEWLARSGAFGLVVIDLGARAAVPMALQSRLVAQAQRHDVGVLCLTEKDVTSSSLSSLVSLRAHAQLRRRGPDAFECVLEVCKDKRRSRPWRLVEVAHGVAGLR